MLGLGGDLETGLWTTVGISYLRMNVFGLRAQDFSRQR